MKLATTIPAIGLIAVAGFAIGRLSAPAGDPVAANSSDQAAAQTRLGSRGEAPAATAERSRRASSRPSGEAREGAEKPDKLADLEKLVRGDNALDRARAMLAFIDTLGPDEFESAVAHFRSLGLTQERMGEYGLLMTAWAQIDPVNALAYATENTGGGFATNTVLATWTTKDPEAAIRWATENHSGEDANPYMASIIGVIAGTDINRATALVGEMPYSRERGEALASIMPHLLALGPDAARTWVTGLKDEQLREGAMARLTEELAASDPQGTAKWLAANPGPGSDRGLGTAVAEWARQDRAAATAYYATLPAGDARSYALRGLVSAVASDDPQAAAGMLTRYSGDVTDSVVRHFVWSSFRSDPATAASNISRINDVEQRDEMYRRTLGGWLRRDPESAQAWIRSNQQLPPAILNDLNRQINEGAGG